MQRSTPKSSQHLLQFDGHSKRIQTYINAKGLYNCTSTVVTLSRLLFEVDNTNNGIWSYVKFIERCGTDNTKLSYFAYETEHCFFSRHRHNDSSIGSKIILFQNKWIERCLWRNLENTVLKPEKMIFFKMWVYENAIDVFSIYT